jgi:prevent-host-death family protein
MQREDWRDRAGILTGGYSDPTYWSIWSRHVMSQFVSLYDAKTHLSSLVDRAAAGEEIVIAKNGIPCARLVPIEQRGEPRKPANGMRIQSITGDFDDPDPRIEALFGGEPG